MRCTRCKMHDWLSNVDVRKHLNTLQPWRKAANNRPANPLAVNLVEAPARNLQLLEVRHLNPFEACLFCHKAINNRKLCIFLKKYLCYPKKKSLAWNMISCAFEFCRCLLLVKLGHSITRWNGISGSLRWERFWHQWAVQVCVCFHFRGHFWPWNIFLYNVHASKFHLRKLALASFGSIKSCHPRLMAPPLNSRRCLQRLWAATHRRRPQAPLLPRNRPWRSTGVEPGWGDWCVPTLESLEKGKSWKIHQIHQILVHNGLH